MKPVTDPNLLEALEGRRPVSDPELLAALDAEDENARREAYYRGPTAGGFPAGGRAKMIEALGNFPRSAAGVLGSMWDAVSSPVDTARAIGTLADQTGNLIGRKAAELRTGRDIAPSEDMPEEAPKAVAGALRDRYGSLEAIGNTLVEDPAGAMLDVAGVGMATRIPGVARTARAIEPVTGTGKAVRDTARGAIPEGAAENLYEGAAKWGTTLTPEERARATRTALDNELMPTPAGLDVLNERIGALNDQLDTLIKNADYYGTQIPVTAVLTHFKQLRRDKGGFKDEAAADLQAIDDAAREFVQQHGQRGTVSVSEMQDFKKDLYTKINWRQRNNKADRPIDEDIAATKARGAKDAVARAVKEAPEINALLSDLYQLQPNLTRAANRIGNLNPMGLTTSIFAGGGAMAAGPVGAVMGTIASMINSPRLRSRVAIALDKLKRNDTQWFQENAGTPEAMAALYLAGNAKDLVAEETDQ